MQRLNRAAEGFRHRQVASTALAWVFLAGCEGARQPSVPPPRSSVPLAIHRGEQPMRIFSAEEEVPSSVYAFEGARGSVRVTMEVEGTSVSTAPAPPFVNDVLFKAEKDGRLAVTFKRPWPGHENGRVTIRCFSGDEESTAEFEPELWFHHPAAIVTFESPLGEPSNPVVEGKEVVLARYVARNIPRDIRVNFKAVFSRDVVPPRMKAGMKPTR